MGEAMPFVDPDLYPILHKRAARHCFTFVPPKLDERRVCLRQVVSGINIPMA
jgi:hypothetical protein